jgi:hypothetical protein
MAKQAKMSDVKAMAMAAMKTYRNDRQGFESWRSTTWADACRLMDAGETERASLLGNAVKYAVAHIEFA